MNYQKIYSFDLSNGEGIRVSLFVSGCTRHCKGCFNKEAWDFCTGKEFSSKEYFKICEYLKNSYYDGLSILGGEPFEQEDFYYLIELCKTAHSYGKNVWIWSGYSFDELRLNKKTFELLKECDILVDGPFIEELKDLSLAWRGSSNQRVIDVKKSLEENRVIEYK